MNSRAPIIWAEPNDPQFRFDKLRSSKSSANLSIQLSLCSTAIKFSPIPPNVIVITRIFPPTVIGNDKSLCSAHKNVNSLRFNFDLISEN